MELSNGKELGFHTHDMNSAHELADVLSDNVVKLGICQTITT
ncbi:hypothetical protein [Bacillus thuringiensis]|nr:hypothetical protein [Bacillus thuringiensis]